MVRNFLSLASRASKDQRAHYILHPPTKALIRSHSIEGRGWRLCKQLETQGHHTAFRTPDCGVVSKQSRSPDTRHTLINFNFICSGCATDIHYKSGYSKSNIGEAMNIPVWVEKAEKYLPMSFNPQSFLTASTFPFRNRHMLSSPTVLR